MGSNPPPGAQVSPDGKWFWDGTKWEPVAAAGGPAAAQLAPMPPAQPAPYVQPPYAYGPRTNSLAVASLVAGILAWLLCPLLGGILAVIFGHVSRGQIKRSGEGGGGMALAGLILGYLNLGGALIAGVIYALLLGGLILYGASGGGGSFPSPSP